MGKIYIIGLGPGDISALTLGAVERINSGDINYLRTEKHPTIKYFKDKDISYKSYDYLYNSEENFESVYEKIAKDLISKSSKYERINYFVPGNPMVAEKTVEILINSGIEYEIISGMSFIEPLIELVEKDPINGLKIVDGFDFNYLTIDINSDMIITQVADDKTLSQVKITLSEVYGDEYIIYLIHSAGVKGEEEKHEIPIYMLDRNQKIGSLTSIYVPKIEGKSKNIFDFVDLLDIMGILRSKDGCSWDIEQSHESIRQGLIEEAYEAVDAIDKGDVNSIVEELGDVLLQVIFHSQIGFEDGEFNIYDITSTLANKLIYRHPHVFEKKDVAKADEIVYNWNKLKYSKRNINKTSDKFKDLSRLPSLMMSYKIQEKAAEIGFDWSGIKGHLDKIKEEYNEVLETIDKYKVGHKRIEEEIGDLIFSIVNLSRFLGVNPEVALNSTIGKFVNRFEYMEEKAEEEGKSLEDMTLEEMDILWNQAKTHNII